VLQVPFEWVYEGYKPLLLPDVLATRKGMSVSLATLLLCVLRRAGLTATPHFQQHGAHSCTACRMHSMHCAQGTLRRRAVAALRSACMRGA
jgi:Transglutaminase-like superfamily